jgi:uncharacterized membrane protein
MREDSRVIFAIAFLGVTVLVDVVEFAEAFWRSAPDPTWETRWKALDPAESAWLAVMGTSRAWLATLTDPEEIELAKGFYLHERRYRVYFGLAALPLMAAIGGLALIGVLPTSVLGLALGTFATLRGVAVYLRERQVKKNYRQAKDNYLAMTTPEPAPAV